jgi:hypothetical protein
MKNNLEKHTILTAGELILFFSILLATYSCRDKSKEGLIPEKTFTSILSDSYLADGLLSMSDIRDKFSKKDSTSNYIDIIKSYGYSYDQMEKTLNYYFINDPKHLVSIYDKIDAKLSEIELKVSAEQENALAAITAKLKRQRHYSLSDPGVKEKLEFSYDIYPPGIFTLEFSVTVYPDDQSCHPSFIAWYSTAEGPDTGQKKYFPAIRYIKDGWPHIYTVKGKIEGNKKSILKGSYFDYENNPDFGRQHAEILNLSFSYIGDLK